MAEWLREMSVGEWYEAGDQAFEIIGVDAGSGVVLVQHFDGALEELDFDSWLELAARPCAAPEDYSGALDMDPADFDYHDHQASDRWDGDSAFDSLNARLDDP